MKNIYVKDIIGMNNSKLLCGDENLVLDNFSKDTRTIKEGDVYLGIKGENFDGNIFFEDALNKGDKVLITDDLLATGGTTEATVELVKKTGADIIGFAFVIELDDLNGRKALEKTAEVFSLIHY